MAIKVLKTGVKIFNKLFEGCIVIQVLHEKYIDYTKRFDLSLDAREGSSLCPIIYIYTFSHNRHNRACHVFMLLISSCFQ